MSGRARSARVLLAAWLALVGCAERSADEPAAAGPRHLLLVTIDTLRADHMSIYGYSRATTPLFDERFANGLIYQRAYAAQANTPPSVASLLTGLHPRDHGVRVFYQLVPAATRLIPDLLPPEYETAAVVSNMVLTDEAMGMASRFDHYDDLVDEPEPYRQNFERSATRTTDAALAWLSARESPERPVFLWVHYMDPHGPYQPPPPWLGRFAHDDATPMPLTRLQRYMRPRDTDDSRDIVDARDYVDRYDEEIAYLDSELERLFEGSVRHLPSERTLVLFTADHGESMIEHERWFWHGYHVYDEIVRVPLVLSGPGVPAGRSEALVSGIDIAPTMLRFAGVGTDGLPGLDLRSPAAIDPDRIVYSEAMVTGFFYRSALQGRRKAVIRIDGDPPGVVEAFAYDLATDPGEQNPLELPASDPLYERLLAQLDAEPDLAGVMAGRLDDSEQGLKIGAPKIAPRVSADALEKLRSLGYAE
jgi:arylsulfatase